MVKCRCARLLQMRLTKEALRGCTPSMKFRFGGALGMTHASLLSYGLNSGNILVWKSTSVRTLLATVQGLDVAYLSSLGDGVTKIKERKKRKRKSDR